MRLRRRLLAVPILTVALLVVGSGAAFACGGLVAPGHAEALRSATTLAAWHDGFEHYVTGFEFIGSAATFGYIIPLPGNPSKIEKGGDWTLERLQREIDPPKAFASDGEALTAARAPSPVQVLQRKKIEALDIVVVRGGGPDVAKWAKDNGFDLTNDAPQVLGAYSDSGAVFALARFDRVGAKEQGLIEGQGTVIHFTIPTAAPWVPLRILALGKGAPENVDADVFVLTDRRPSFSPAIGEMAGMRVRADRPAGDQLLADLRSDRGMTWLPTGGMWLTALSLGTHAGTITYDLSINGGGPKPGPIGHPIPIGLPWAWWFGAAGLVALVWMAARTQRPRMRVA